MFKNHKPFLVKNAIVAARSFFITGLFLKVQTVIVTGFNAHIFSSHVNVCCKLARIYSLTLRPNSYSVRNTTTAN